jgi:hypothetical protein
MSFAQLLTMGKSVVRTQTAPGRYRVRRSYRLPKFETPITPAPLRSGLTGVAQLGAPAATPARGIAIPGREEGTVHAVKEATVPVTGRTMERGVLAVRQVGSGVAGFCDGVAVVWRRLFPPPVNRTHRSALQGEVCLDSIQVLRNDLCDADLEILPRRKARAAAVPAEAPDSAAGMREPAGLNWMRIAWRLFAAARTRI